MARKARLEAVIGLKTTAFARGLKRVRVMLKRFRGGLRSFAQGFKTFAIRAAVGFGVLGFAIKKAFDFELYRNQFKILIGDVGRAKKQFEFIRELSAETPFQIEELIKTSKALLNMGILGEENRRIMIAVGDAAASINPSTLEEMGFWMARLNVEAQKGSAGRATLRLLQLGGITPAVKSQLDDMITSGAMIEDVMNVAISSLERFQGGMKFLARTGSGLFSTMRDNWTLSVVTFGDALREQAKGGISALIDEMKRLRTDGTIERWAKRTLETIQTVAGAIKAIVFGGDTEAGKEAATAFVDFFQAVMGMAVRSIFKLLVSGLIGVAKIFGAVLKKEIIDILPFLGGAARAKLEQEADATIAAQVAKFGAPDESTFIGELDKLLKKLEKFKLILPEVDPPRVPNAQGAAGNEFAGGPARIKADISRQSLENAGANPIRKILGAGGRVRKEDNNQLKLVKSNQDIVVLSQRAIVLLSQIKDKNGNAIF